MNPKDFDWDQDQQVTVTNPTAKAHSFQVHSKFYEVGPHETVRMPGFMAWVFVYTLALELAQRAGEYENKWNDASVRQRYYNKVIVGADELIQKIEPVETSPIEKAEKGETRAVAAAKAAKEAQAAADRAAEEQAAAEKAEAEEKAAAEQEKRAAKEAADKAAARKG
jgi:hypothetical protein